MAAPEFVPTAGRSGKHYTAPRRQLGTWSASRPGETVGAAPGGTALGAQGPDQGFVYKLLSVFDDEIRLAEGEHRSDVDEGCIGVALKRASLFHRAPVVHDLRIAYDLFGFLSDAPDDLVAARKPIFSEVHHSFHYFERRAIADLVSDDVLRQSPDQVATRAAKDWRDQLPTLDA